MPFQLPALPYAYDALEPFIDAHTVELHLEQHHNSYVRQLNTAIEGTGLDRTRQEELMGRISGYPAALAHCAGGHFNHCLFWESLSPTGGDRPGERTNIYRAINRDFGHFDRFRESFIRAAKNCLGPGWVWLCADRSDRLFVCTTRGNDNPLMDTVPVRGTPLLALDLWEHAYYLNYQSRRDDYVKSFFNVINWQAVTERFNRANPGAMQQF